MTKIELIERFTEQRVKLSEIRDNLNAQYKKVYKDMPFTDLDIIVSEVHQAKTSVNLAFMWLGKAKGFLGAEHPYKQSYNPDNKVIEKAVDVSEKPGVKEYANPIEMLKSIRADLKQLDREITSNLGYASGDSHELFESVQNAFTRFHEGCMWLGVGLGNIKDSGLEETISWETPGEEDEEEDDLPDNPTPEQSVQKDTSPILGATSIDPDADLAPKPEPEMKVSGSTLRENDIKLPEPKTEEKQNEGDIKGGTEAGNTKGGHNSGSGKDKSTNKTSGGQGNLKGGSKSGKN